MKFSIRDLLLVTVIVALVLGWGLREWQLRAKVSRWRNAAGALEYLVEDDWDVVEWENDLSQVRVSRRPGAHSSQQFGLDTDQFGLGRPLVAWARSHERPMETKPISPQNSSSPSSNSPSEPAH
jgi:hypothetical protein